MVLSAMPIEDEGAGAVNATGSSSVGPTVKAGNTARAGFNTTGLPDLPAVF